VAAATGMVPPQAPSALCRATRRPAVSGSRFWALAGESSDEESDGEELEVRVSSLLQAPSAVTVGDFIYAVLASGPASSCRSASRARSAFALGGRGPRWLASSTVSSPNSVSMPELWPSSSPPAAPDPDREPVLPSSGQRRAVTEAHPPTGGPSEGEPLPAGDGQVQWAKSWAEPACGPWVGALRSSRHT
jgi:hypothetical protein